MGRCHRNLTIWGLYYPTVWGLSWALISFLCGLCVCYVRMCSFWGSCEPVLSASTCRVQPRTAASYETKLLRDEWPAHLQVFLSPKQLMHLYDLYPGLIGLPISLLHVIHRYLDSMGIQLVLGFVILKTHTKASIIIRCFYRKPQ